jgi:hypothetical protein
MQRHVILFSAGCVEFLVETSHRGNRNWFSRRNGKGSTGVGAGGRHHSAHGCFCSWECLSWRVLARDRQASSLNEYLFSAFPQSLPGFGELRLRLPGTNSGGGN